MCRGVERLHDQCRHLEFVITRLCESAIETGTPCTRDQCSFIGGEIVSPPLCLICYRKIEEQICDTAKEALRQINVESKRIREQLEDPELKPEDRTGYEELLREALRLHQEILESQASDLTEFRRSQGVWGDG
ncbi:hypothetical protein MMC07_001931 [Pseudocyphellaria aurata]|nr:hypothetical protein [Pseudocyphellaria aurata]